MQNIGTYATEDEAYETLNTLCIALPLTVFFTWVLDALLAAAYLKWFHPWRILLQEVAAFLNHLRIFPPLYRNVTNVKLILT